MGNKGGWLLGAIALGAGLAWAEEAPPKLADPRPGAPAAAASKEGGAVPEGRAAVAVPAAAGGGKAAPPAEYVLALRQADWRARVTLRPGAPEAGRLVEIFVDLSKSREVPDPTYGDNVPATGVQLSLAMSGPGGRVRYLLRPLGDAGAYGAHWTPAAKGLWTVTLAPLAPGLEGPELKFEVGVGVPMPASSQGQAVQASRVVLGAPKAQPEAPRLAALMREIAARHAVFAEPSAGDAAAEGKALAALFQRAAGRVPRQWASAGAEFDALAADAAREVEKAASLPAAERAARARALESGACLRCHVKFRDGVVADVSNWPEVSPWRK